MTGVAVGAVVYYIIYQIIIFVGIDTNMLKMFSAIVVAAFLGIPYLKGKLFRSGKRTKGGVPHA